MNIQETQATLDTGHKQSQKSKKNNKQTKNA
jgi:hypothetical protein